MDVSQAGARLDEQGWLGLPAPTEPRQPAGGEAIEAAARTPLDPAGGDPAVAVATLIGGAGDAEAAALGAVEDRR
jgi:hypothetical protein